MGGFPKIGSALAALRRDFGVSRRTGAIAPVAPSLHPDAIALGAPAIRRGRNRAGAAVDTLEMSGGARHRWG